MYSIFDFIRWALTHARRSTVPAGAELALPLSDCGRDPWQYLFGSIRVMTTDANLNTYYNKYYKNTMTRAEYDAITAPWSRTGYATDCQGLLDAWLTYEMNDPTDINADGNYRLWCTDKRLIADSAAPFRTGEAVFRANGDGRMTHVGWICGSLEGEPLVIEARSIRCGVSVSKLSARGFTHRALMTRKFSYGDDEMDIVKLEYRLPMMRGDEILALQFALNRLGYVGADGARLTEDGKLGKNTMFAVEHFAQVQSPAPEAGPVFRVPDEGGRYLLKITVEENEAPDRSGPSDPPAE